MISHWLLAARPKTLLAGFCPVAMGAMIAVHDGSFLFWPVASCLLLAVSVQVGTNFCNDYFDFFQGADTEDRKGPTRAVQAGLVSPQAMLFATIIMFSVSGLATWMLFLRVGWPFLVLGLLSILFGVLYTAGRFSLAYLGIADPFVLVFFGPVAVAGTHLAQSLNLDPAAIVAGFGLGTLATGLLVVNNLRDIDEDRMANKRTLAVRFGPTFSRYQYAACILASSVFPVVYSCLKGIWWPSLASLVLIPGAFVISKVWNNDGLELRPCLGMTAGLLFLYTVLFCVGICVEIIL